MSNADLQNIDTCQLASIKQVISEYPEAKLHDILNKEHQIKFGTINSLERQNSQGKSH